MDHLRIPANTTAQEALIREGQTEEQDGVAGEQEQRENSFELPAGHVSSPGKLQLKVTADEDEQEQEQEQEQEKENMSFLVHHCNREQSTIQKFNENAESMFNFIMSDPDWDANDSGQVNDAYTTSEPDEYGSDMLMMHIDSAHNKLQSQFQLERANEYAKPYISEQNTSTSGLSVSSSSSDNESFITASEIPFSTESHQQKAVSFDVESFSAPPLSILKQTQLRGRTIRKISNSSSVNGNLNNFHSNPLPLKKLTPFPCDNLSEKCNSKADQKRAKEPILKPPRKNHARSTKKRKDTHLSALFDKFKKGDIIKLDKMLVKVSAESKFINRQIEARDRFREDWREYLVVCRSTGNDDYPAILQFYKTNRVLKRENSSMENLDLIVDEEKLYDDIDDDHHHHNLESLNAIQVKRKKIKKRHGRSWYFKLIISKKDTSATFSNLLDKGIQIKKEHKNLFVKYTLLTDSFNSSICWLNLIRQLCQSKKSNHDTLFVRVPSIDISFTLTGIQSLYTNFVKNEMEEDNYLTVTYRPDGYDIPQIKVFENLLNLIEKKITIIQKSKKFLKSTELEKVIEKLHTNRRFLALSFRKFDRLEWLVGNNQSFVHKLWSLLGSTYEIEVRDFIHDSHSLIDESIVEPFPIEGFVVKLSNRKGKTSSIIGRNYFKLLYAFTCDNMLFFQDFYNAVPSFHINTSADNKNNDYSQTKFVRARNFISPTGTVLDLDQLERAFHDKSSSNLGVKVDLSVESTTFAKDGNHIEWIKPGISNEEYLAKDKDALFEAERKASLVLNSIAVVDLCRVKDVRAVPLESISALVKNASLATWHLSDLIIRNSKWRSRFSQGKGNHNCGHLHKRHGFLDAYRRHHGAKSDEVENLSDDDSDEANEENQLEITDNYFEIVLQDDSILRLEVGTRSLRDEWISRLSSLSTYWKKKKAEKIASSLKMQEMNMKAMHASSVAYESVISNEIPRGHNKWELKSACTDTELYSISSYSLDKPVLMYGELYERIDKHNFKKYFVVLSPGFLVLYDMVNRSIRLKSKAATYYKKSRTLALMHCYISAEEFASEEIKKQANGLNSRDILPRSYEDGWKSNELKKDRSFSIWFGTKRILLKKDKIENKKGEHLQLGDVVNTSESDLSSEDEDQDEDENSASESELSGNSDNSQHDSDGHEGMGREFCSKPEFWKAAPKLGAKGRFLTFLARSRIERDLWVTRIISEIDRFSATRTSDVFLD
ncbi:Spo71 protein [Martiniozyma asiatica (nom. inval.)]|nr:Spo71 protein [Martiniozyma asiatica]